MKTPPAMQETQVRSLVLEDSTCSETVKPLRSTEPVLWSPGATTPGACEPKAYAPQREKPLQ